MKVLNSGLFIGLLLLTQVFALPTAAAPFSSYERQKKKAVFTQADHILSGSVAFRSEPHGSLHAKVYDQNAAFQYEFILSRSGPKFSLPAKLTVANVHLIEAKGKGTLGLVIDDLKSKRRYVLYLSGMSPDYLTNRLPKMGKPLQFSGYAFDVVI